jgi:hypothetical protein
MNTRMTLDIALPPTTGGRQALEPIEAATAP